jgi:hypothetical protein
MCFCTSRGSAFWVLKTLWKTRIEGSTYLCVPGYHITAFGEIPNSLFGEAQSFIWKIRYVSHFWWKFKNYLYKWKCQQSHSPYPKLYIPLPLTNSQWALLLC